MNKKRIPLLTALIIAIGLLSSCRHITAPEYIDVNNVQFGAQSLTNPTLSATVRMYNPNKSNLIFKSGSLNIYVDNRLLGHTELDSTIYIQKSDTFQIPVKVQIEFKNVIGNALSLAMKDSVLVRLEGKIKIGRSGFFITRPVRFEQKERLDLF